MKKDAKNISKTAKPKKKPDPNSDAVLPTAKYDQAARARRRVEASRKAALQRVVSQSSD
jgi:hypothetical protein